jgi:sugar diacid utilization regulator
MGEYIDFCRRLLESLQEMAAYIQVTDENGKLIARTWDGQPDKVLADTSKSILQEPFMVLPGVVWHIAVAAHDNSRDRSIILLQSIKAALQAAAQYISLAGTRSREELMVKELLSPAGDSRHDNTILISNLKQSGLDVTQSRAVILIDLEEEVNRYFNIHLDLGYDASAEKAKAETIQMIKANRHITKQDIVASYGASQIVIIKAFMEITEQGRIYRALDRVCETILNEMETSKIFAIRLAYGSLCDDFADIRQSYQEAKLLIQLGMTFLGRNGLYKYEDLLAEYITYNLPDRMLVKTLRPLADKLKQKGDAGDEELLYIVEAYINDNFNLTETSRKLYLHRNTVAGKVEKYKKITGLDPGERYLDALLTKILAIYMRLCAAGMK